MKVAVSATGMDLDSQVDPRFGRCACFILVETEDMSFDSFDNENISLSGGAGIQSGSFVAAEGAKAVLTGKCGPKAMQTLVAAGIDVFTEQNGTVRDVVERFKLGNLSATTEANAPEKSGVNMSGMTDGGGGMGTGRGMGGGGGMGTGRGMGGGGGTGTGRCMGGSGRGMGGGRGTRGMGRGMVSGQGAQASGFNNTGSASKADALKLLKEQAGELKKQMNDIESKIRGLE